jgi:hypothetical protein
MMVDERELIHFLWPHLNESRLDELSIQIQIARVPVLTEVPRKGRFAPCVSMAR